MLNLGWRTMATNALANSLIAVLVLLVAGCAGPPPEQTPPPPMASADTPAPAPDLAGGPPEAQPPAPAQDDYSAQMAPIPNPEDLTPAQRARIYGDRYDRQTQGQFEPSAPVASAHRRRTYYGHHAHAPAVATAPAHTTHVWAQRGHVATGRHGSHHRQAPLAPAIPPHHTAALKPSLSPAPAPATVAKPVAPAPLVKAAPVTSTDRLAQMQTALSGPVADGAGFVVAEDLTAGKPGAVTLSLPADLFSRVRAEAAKAGLSKAAHHFDITATLSGDAYTISPASGQVMAAPAEGSGIGQAPSFAWQVQPQAGAGGPLKAVVFATLRGVGAPQTVPLLTLERPIKPAVAADQQPATSNDPFNLHMGAVDLPGLGKIPVSSILAVILLILVVVILVAAARHTAERDREERRKARAAARAALLQEEAEAPPVDAFRPPPTSPHPAASPSESDRKPETV